MKFVTPSIAVRRLLVGSALLFVMATTFAQVNPDDVLNPTLKAEEVKYFPQLQALQESIATAKFPFPFRLARYANARPRQKAASDPNGIEFVYFDDREVLKISGIYKAAYNSTQLSENQRAARTFEDVVVPILRLVAQRIPANIDCDSIGFEIVYNTRDANKAYDYEGQEVLTAVFNVRDAFAYLNATGDADRQKILNRSDIFVDGREFGLALGQRDPLNMQALERSTPRRARRAAPSLPAGNAPAPAALASADPVSAAVSVAPSTPAPKPPSAPADATLLQTRFQAQLNAIMKEDGAKFSLVASPAPSFESDGDRTILHLAMKSTLPFEPGTSSIYKRGAQDFDLFLAPELKALLSKLPADAEYDALDFSVQNRLGSGESSSETIDYICPLSAVRSFVQNKITNQDLINQSIVLVNGVRIGLNLQLVE